jgi:hypothetical protein
MRLWDEMFGVALSVLDVVDGSRGVYPQSSHPERVRPIPCSICVVAHRVSPTVSSSPAAPVFAAIWLREEDVIAKTPVRFFRTRHSRSSCPAGIPQDRVIRLSVLCFRVQRWGRANSLFLVGTRLRRGRSRLRSRSTSNLADCAERNWRPVLVRLFHLGVGAL